MKGRKMVASLQETMEKDQRNIIVFNASKKELFTVSSGYKSLQKKLRTNWKIQSFKDEITEEKLIGVKLWITAGPREKFTAAEVRKNINSVNGVCRYLTIYDRCYDLHG
ncbi:intraflagellar transport protein 52 homolog [Rhincodon typus]|uniref:intraflagellar transport protein 52 homolog n=1 Tax=Rhincodon typus TaxID=259920 RepID=UPI00202E210D|nr:intraflagellar transport protein 52 homolog [Rhincodon typus]